MATHGSGAGRHRSTVGEYRLRLRNLPITFAQDAPHSEAALVHLIHEHTGIHTLHPRTCYNQHDGDQLFRTIAQIVTNGVPWDAEWCHDSTPALVVGTFTLTNPLHPPRHNVFPHHLQVALCSRQHNWS